MKWKIVLFFLAAWTQTQAVTLGRAINSAVVLNGSSAVQRHKLVCDSGIGCLPMSSGIYLIRNVINGKEYIGSAISVRKRIRLHLFNLSAKKHCNRHLQSSYNKHGKSNFRFGLLEKVACKVDLVPREQFWINLVKPAYNICRIASSVLGVKRSLETRRKMSRSMKLAMSKRQPKKLMVKKRTKAIFGSEEHKQKLRAAILARDPDWKKRLSLKLKGRPKPQWFRDAVSKTLQGHPVSVETRLKMSLAKRGKPWSIRAHEAHCLSRMAKARRSKQTQK